MRRSSRWASFGTATTTLAAVMFGVAGVGPLAQPAAGEATTGRPAGLAAGTATAAGVLVGYSDRDTFYPGSPTEPPNTYVPYATGGFDNTGAGSASAALVYNPYQDFAGAINGLAPPGSPEVPAGELRARSQASVRGAPPQTYDASLSPGEEPAVGTMRAVLDEAGPKARAEAVAAGGEVIPGLRVTSASTNTLMSRADGKAHSVASTVLNGVSVNDVLTFRTVAVDVTSTADGGEGAALATVRVAGAAVNGTAIELTEAGLMVAGTAAPLSSDQVNAALQSAGVELVAPARRTVTPNGDSSVATAHGPSLVITHDGDQRIEVTLGSVSAVALLFDSTAAADPAPAGDTSDPAAASSSSTNSTPTLGERSPDAATPADAAPAEDNLRTQPTGIVFPASAGSPQRGAWAAPDTAVAAEPIPVGAVLQTHSARSAAGDGFRRLSAALADTTTLADSRTTDRTELAYGVLVAVAGLLVVGGLCVPRGDLWSGGES